MEFRDHPGSSLLCYYHSPASIRISNHQPGTRSLDSSGQMVGNRSMLVVFMYLCLDEDGALTISHRCEFEHCVQRTLEIGKLIWKGEG